MPHFHILLEPLYLLGKVLVCNGSSLSISFVASSIIQTGTKPLMLNNMLYDSRVTNNLIFMSQLFRDDNVYFEFHVAHCLIEDFVTHCVLLKVIESRSQYRVIIMHKRSHPFILVNIPSKLYALHSRVKSWMIIFLYLSLFLKRV